MFRRARLVIILRIVSIIILRANPILVMGLVLSLRVGAVIFISWGVSSWFGIIVIIIYVGGMLVMFSYFVALSPNQVFNILPVLSMGVVSCVFLRAMTVSRIPSGVGPRTIETGR